MKNQLKRIFSATLCFLFISSQALAQSSSYLGVQRFDNAKGAEFVSGNLPGTVLMRVNLWGAVNRPGIHHIPVKTDLMSLMSYAGGPSKSALLDKVTIKREVGTTRKLIKIDVEELVKGVSHHHVELAPNDIIVIPRDEPLIDADTIAVVSLVSVVMSTILAAVLVDSRRD